MNKMKLICMFLVLSLLHTSASAEMADLTTNINDSNILEILDGLSWIPDGPDNGRHIYVLGAGWCPACKALYKRTRGLNKKVQFRWIMLSPKSPYEQCVNANLALSRDPLLLAKYYGRVKIKCSDDKKAAIIDEWNQISVNFVQVKLQEKIGPLGYPCLLYYDGTRLQVTTGVPSDLTRLIENVVPRETDQKSYARAVRVMPEKLDLFSLKSDKIVVKADKATIYCGPTEDSLPLASLDKNDVIGAQGIIKLDNGKMWIHVPLLKNGIGGWTLMENYGTQK